jgi:hypothetical protein
MVFDIVATSVAAAVFHAAAVIAASAAAPAFVQASQLEP